MFQPKLSILTHASVILTFAIKYNQFRGMSSLNVVSHVVNHILSQGKQTLHDRFIDKQKVPKYANIEASSGYQQYIIHAGYKAESIKRYAYFQINRDSLPDSCNKDNIASKTASIQKTKSKIKSPNDKFYPLKSQRHRKAHSIKNSRFNTMRQNVNKQKQNSLIKLEQDNGNRIIIQRAKLRQSAQEEEMRQLIRKRLIKQYQERLSNEVFDKNREDRKNQKSIRLKQHLTKGDNFKFNFDNEGEFILFEQCGQQQKKQYPPQTHYKIQTNGDHVDEEIPVQNKFQRHKSYDFRNKKVDLQELLIGQGKQSQKIRSARGEAFSSSVLKTVNLSRISMNNSLREIDAQEFMKRNDLFNNNHSRQTTSIPYLHPNSGTVYTEVATNQIISSFKQNSQATTKALKSSPSNISKASSNRKNNFASFYRSNQADSCAIEFNHQNKGKQGENAEVRPQKTFLNVNQQDLKSSRPKTSVSKGRITAMNENLVLSLLK